MRSKNISLDSFILHDQVKRPVDWDDQFHSARPLDVEIGFGNGDFLVRTAQDNPTRNYVGIEQEWERVRRTLKKIGRHKIDNIRLLLIDARVGFERLFSPATIQNIYCLFPCPWPKKRHVKHRLFSRQFIELLNSRMAGNGRLKIVTDLLKYQRWVLAQSEGAGFDIKKKTINPKYDTKYERKWFDQGQKEFFELQMTKREHVDHPLKEDVALKRHIADNFDPKSFKMANTKGEIAIIFKELLYDSKSRKAMIHLIVSEGNLTQHIWVAVTYKRRKWHIYPAEGNRFIPTEGVAKALEIISEQCRER